MSDIQPRQILHYKCLLLGIGVDLEFLKSMARNFGKAHSPENSKLDDIAIIELLKSIQDILNKKPRPEFSYDLSKIITMTQAKESVDRLLLENADLSAFKRVAYTTGELGTVLQLFVFALESSTVIWSMSGFCSNRDPLGEQPLVCIPSGSRSFMERLKSLISHKDNVD